MIPQGRKDAKENQVKEIRNKNFSLCELSVLAGEKSDFRTPYP
jgi:hypothetical protein